MEKEIDVYQPATLRDEAFASLLSELSPDLIVVVAFGKILPQSVLDFPKYGCINVHGSLLPKYRGAAPMQRAVMDGKTVTGITTMYMADGIDTGDMLLKYELPIGENDDFEVVHDSLGALGAKALLDTIDLIERGEAVRVPQDETLATYAKKITKDDCLLCFDGSARDLHNLIRGLSPFPLAFTHTPDGKLLKIIETRVADDTREHSEDECGKVLSTDNGIEVACKTGSIRILRLLPEGKSRMSAEDFIRGRKISVGDKLS
jgi:methionyl-tRNA formyltransferase